MIQRKGSVNSKTGQWNSSNQSIKKNRSEDSSRNLWDNTKPKNIQIIWSFRGEKQQKTYLKKQWLKTSLTQKRTQYPDSGSTENSNKKHKETITEILIIKMLKLKDKDYILRMVENQLVTYKEPS